MIRVVTLIVAGSMSSASAVADRSRQITAHDLASIRDIGGHHNGAISLSPKGKLVAFQLQTPLVDERNYKLTWYVAEAHANGNVWPVGDGGEVILNPQMKAITNGDRPPARAVWSFDGQWIIYLKRLAGTTQLWRSRRDGRVQEQLTHNNGNVLAFTSHNDKVFYTVSEDTAIISQRLNDEGAYGFLFDDRFHPTISTKPLVRTCGFNSRGKPIEVNVARKCAAPVWVYVLSKGIARPASEDEIAAYYSTRMPPPTLADRDVHFFHESNDGTKAYWLENENPSRLPGFAAPVRLFAAIRGTEFRCSAEECEGYAPVMEGVWFGPGSDEIVFQRADGPNASMTGIYTWKPGSASVRRVLQTEDKLADCEVAEHYLICLREQWTHPRTIVSAYLNTGEIRTIYDPNPQFNDIEFSRVQKIEWKDRFGDPTHGHLVYPSDYQPGRRYPLVITTYRSRGFLRGGVGDEYPIHLLAASGFFVLSHDKSRSFERYATMSDSGQAEFEELHERHSSLSAQERILEILDQRGLVDLQRTAITGLSDGADQVIFALIQSDSFTTGIISGIFDRRAYYYLSNKNWRSYLERLLGGLPKEDKTGSWCSLSLGCNIDQVAAPLLVNTSDQELLSSVETFYRLKDADIAVEMYVFPGEYHIKWQPQHRLAIYRRNVQWLKFWLQGLEVDDPVSSNQYDRWRRMRDKHCARKGHNMAVYCNSG